MTADDGEFERRVSDLLEESAGGLSGRVRSRLTQARHAALAAHRPSRSSAWRSWAPAGAVAASVLLALVVLSDRGMGPTGSGPATTLTTESPSAFDDLELLADNDAIDLANADEYDFYEWAAGQGSDGGGEEVGS